MAMIADLWAFLKRNAPTRAEIVAFLKRLVLLWVGFCLSVVALAICIKRMLEKGLGLSSLLEPRIERDRQPATLRDERWGTHHNVHLPGGIRIHYVQRGDPTKPLMLFVHGFPDFWYTWRYQMEHFSSDYRCVAFDTRGYGDSGKPPSVHDYSIEKLRDDIKNLIEALGYTSCTLVAHDWGAVQGYAVCQKYPELVDRYVVFNLPHPKALAKQREQGLEQSLRSWYVFFFACPWIPELFVRFDDLWVFDRMFEEMEKPDDREAIEAYKYTFRYSDAFFYPINYYRHAVLYNSNRVSDESSNVPLEKIQVPVLNIHGGRDSYLSRASAKDSHLFVENLRLEILDGISHWSPTQDPEKVNKIIYEYLTEKGNN